ncbi:MAG: hypothetical protein JWQ12_2290 [Glaciihabitans sp.]|nr:hypothetical protein [Glaciihabitans sp.]
MIPHARQPGAPRVVLIHSSDELYGADRIALQVAECLEETGRVEVWLPRECPKGALTAALNARGVPVRRVDLPILRRRDLGLRGGVRLLVRSLSTLRELRSRRFDLVYLGTSACLVVAPLARLAGDRRVVLHVQEQWQPRERRILRLLARACSRILAVSPEALRSTGLAGRRRSAVVSNATPDRSDEVRAPLAPSTRPRYVVASRWSPGKGHATLLAAWELAGCPGDLVLLGGPPPLGRAVDVPGLVSQLVSHPETVTIVGEVPDATPYLSAADAVVLPSDGTEGLGLVLLEAACLSVPAIASRCGGPEGVIEDGRSGWLFDRGDREALARLFGQLDRATLAQAGQLARLAYERDYTPAVMHDALVSILGADLRRRPRPATTLLGSTAA